MLIGTLKLFSKQLLFLLPLVLLASCSNGPDLETHQSPKNGKIIMTAEQLEEATVVSPPRSVQFHDVHADDDNTIHGIEPTVAPLPEGSKEATLPPELENFDGQPVKPDSVKIPPSEYRPKRTGEYILEDQHVNIEVIKRPDEKTRKNDK